jgi:hypothetical protein
MLLTMGKTKGFIEPKGPKWVGGWVGLMNGRTCGWMGFININDMYNNDVGKGGVWVYEAYEVK